MVRFENVSMTYPGGDQRAIDDMSFTIDDGEFVFLVGPSGSGKTSVIKLITGEVAAQSGELFVNGFDLMHMRRGKIPAMRRTIGVVYQDFRLIEDKTVYENVALAMHVVGAPRREIRRHVPYVLELVGLAGRENRFPREISGGEQQRVAVARAIVNNPQLLIADEPTGNIDPARSLELMLLMDRINEMGTTVLVVTHEKELVNSFSKRVVAIEDGQVTSDGMDGYYSYEIE